jgi:hypothetical protein
VNSLGVDEIPQNADYIERLLQDLHESCVEHDIEYRVVGSTATVCASGQLYRIPHDVDFIYDISKKKELHKELLSRGYQEKVQDFPIPIFVNPLTHYVKNGRLLEPRAGLFTDRGFELLLTLPLPLPKRRWPIVSLIFTPTMFASVRYYFGKTSFTGLSASALWLGLELMPSVDGKQKQRHVDQEMLLKAMNEDTLDQIIREKPGLYYKNFPLATPYHTEIVRFIALLVRMKQLLGG